MDYVTRQFINLAKKLRNDVREALQQLTDAVRQTAKTTRQNKQDPLPIPLPVQVELQIPQAIQAEQRAQYDRSQTLQVWLVLGTWLTFIAAALYAGLTYGILHDAQYARRPWLGTGDRIKVTSAPLFYPHDFAGKPAIFMSIQYAATIQNFGQTPALKEFDTVAAYTFREQTHNPWKHSCSRFKEPSDEIRKSIFPGEIRTVTGTTDVMVKLESSPKAMGVGIIACITYLDNLGKVRHTETLYKAVPIPPHQSYNGADPLALLRLVTEFQVEDSSAD